MANVYFSVIYVIESSGLAKIFVFYIENWDVDDDGIENWFDCCFFEFGEGASDGCLVEKID